jgi:hypothetical protein
VFPDVKLREALPIAASGIEETSRRLGSDPLGT